MRIKSKLLLVFLVLMSIGVFIGCTRTITNVEPDTSFKWDRYYISNGTIYNFYTNSYSNNELFIASQWRGLRIFNDLTVEPEWISIPSLTVGYEDKPYVYEKFTVVPVVERDRLVIYSNNGCNHCVIYININSFGEEFSRYSFRRTGYQRVAGATNNHNRYITTISESSWGGGRKYIVYFDLEFDMLGQISMKDQGYWDVDSMHHYLNGEGRIYDIHYFNDKFYVAYRTYSINYLTISNEGIINEYINPFGNYDIWSFFTYKDYIFVSVSDGIVRYSSDGENWQPIFSMSGFYDLVEIDDYIFMYTNDRIFFIANLFTEEAGIYELPIANMSGVQITSINQFKEYIVITTSNGIYYKSIEEALKEKKVANFSRSSLQIELL